jgi:hypothetical protein
MAKSFASPKSESYVHFYIGDSTIALPIETCARFPMSTR